MGIMFQKFTTGPGTQVQLFNNDAQISIFPTVMNAFLEARGYNVAANSWSQIKTEALVQMHPNGDALHCKIQYAGVDKKNVDNRIPIIWNQDEHFVISYTEAMPLGGRVAVGAMCEINAPPGSPTLYVENFRVYGIL